MRIYSRQHGYTMLETVLYTAVFAFLSVIIVYSLITVSRSFLDLRIERAINNTATVALDRIVREIRRADNVDIINSQFGVHPGVLDLDTTDSEDNPISLRFSIEDGRIKIEEDGVNLGFLGPESVSVDNLVFRLDTDGAVQAVKIEATLTDNRGENPTTRNFYNTALVRGTY